MISSLLHFFRFSLLQRQRLHPLLQPQTHATRPFQPWQISSHFANSLQLSKWQLLEALKFPARASFGLCLDFLS